MTVSSSPENEATERVATDAASTEPGAADAPAGGAGPAPASISEIGRLRRLYPFVRPYGLAIGGALVCLTVASVTVLALGVGLRRLVDEGFASGNVALMDQALFALLVIVTILAAASFGRFYLVSWIGERVSADIRRAVFDHLLSLSPEFFEVTRTGELMSRLTTDSTLLQAVIGSSVSVALRNTLMLVGGLVMLVVTSPKMTGLVVLVVPLVIVPIVLIGRRVRRLSRASQDRIADIGVYAEEAIGGIRTVQAFVHEAWDRRRFGERVEDAFATAIRRVAARAWLTGVVIFLVFGAVSFILWLGGHDVLAGRISAGELSAFVFYAVVVAGSVGAVTEVIGDLQRAAGASERLLDLLEVRPQITAPAEPQALPEPPIGAVAFEAVSFAYPTRPERSALREFSLVASPGERVALVGPSGGGKSTVFQLLLRFYDPEAGAITLDGVALKEAAPQDVRRRIGLVAQEPAIFAASAADNIRYGRPEASDEEVRAAAEAVGVTEFLDCLVNGFDTYLGERGVRLSGGQRQRIALARAILRDPAVLLLDEATSALDAESEQIVQAALERMMVGRTTLMIAHRLATVMNADRIVVMSQGHAIATGTHAELVAESPLYAHLAKLQFGQARTHETAK